MKLTIIACVVTGATAQSYLRMSAPGPAMFAKNAQPAMFKQNVQAYAGARNEMPASPQIDRRQMAALLTAGAIGLPTWETQAGPFGGGKAAPAPAPAAKAKAAPPPANTAIPLVNFGSTGYDLEKGPGADRSWRIQPSLEYLNSKGKLSFKGNLDPPEKQSNDVLIVSTIDSLKPFADVSSCEGIAISAKGNGYPGFKMNLGIDPKQKSVLAYQYSADFSAPTDEYGTVKMPFTAFASPKGEGIDPGFLTNIQRIAFEAEGVAGDAALNVESIGGYGCKNAPQLIEEEDQDDTTLSWYLAAAPLGLLAFFIARSRVRKAPVSPTLLG